MAGRPSGSDRGPLSRLRNGGDVAILPVAPSAFANDRSEEMHKRWREFTTVVHVQERISTSLLVMGLDYPAAQALHCSISGPRVQYPAPAIKVPRTSRFASTFGFSTRREFLSPRERIPDSGVL